MSDKFQEYRERAQKRALTVYGCFRVNLSGVSKGGRVLVLTEQFAALYTTSKKPSETVYEWIDAKSYNWEDETSAIKNNLNVVFEFLASWAIVVILCIPFFLFNIFDHLIYYTIFVSIVFVILIVIMYIFGPKIILRSLKKGS